MRISFVLPRTSTSPVGALKVIYRIADGLASIGHKVTLVHRGSPGADRPGLWYRSRASVRSVVAASVDDTTMGGAFDVVVATSWRVVREVASLDDCSVLKVLFLHDFESYELGSRAERADIRECLRVGWPIIAGSNPVRELVESVTGRTCPVVSCAIDADTFRLHRRLDDPARHLVGFPARDEKAKRTPDAVAALAAVRSSRREHLDVWSFGAYQGQLPGWMTHYRLPTDIELCHLYNQTAVFVVPSELEGFGLSGAEAMACGAALVSTRNRGVEAYATDGDSAVLCPARQPAHLAHAVNQLLDNHELRYRIARSGVYAATARSWADATAEFAHLLGLATPHKGLR